jgi:hypothetical protein
MTEEHDVFTPPESVFARQREISWPIAFDGELFVENLVAGVPSNEHVAEAWIKSKTDVPDNLLREAVAQTMAELGITKDEAIKVVDEQKNLNRFKRDETGLYLEGRQLKSAIKEAVSVAIASKKLKKQGWGATNKGLLSFIAEHVHVPDRRLYLGTDDADGVRQQFVHTFRGSSIKYEEFVDAAKITFTVETDWPLTDDEWMIIWTTGERLGIGASRSQSWGQYVVTKWEQTRDRRNELRATREASES